MHELGATQSVINVLLEQCLTRKLKRIKAVHVNIGMLSTYEEKPLKYYFDLLKVQHTALSKTTLKTSMLPGNIHCEACGEDTKAINAFDMVCKHCKSIKTRVTQGKDVVVSNIEV